MHQTGSKRIQGQTRLVEKGDPLGIYKRLILDHNYKWCTHKLESVLDNETHGIILIFKIQMYHPIERSQR